MASNPSTHLGELFKSSRKKGEEGLPLLSVTLNNGLIVRDQLDRRTETNLEASEHLLVQSGDIAYNMMRVWQGALGRASVNGLVSPAYVVLRPTAKIDSLYAEYLFKTPRMIYLFWAYSYGLTKDRLRLYFNDFSRIPVTIPDLKEQRKIAQILSTWDKAITTTEQLLANSQQQKKALMQQLLTGKKRLLDKNGVRFSGEWIHGRLGDLCTFKGGSAFKEVYQGQTAGEFPFIKVSDMNLPGNERSIEYSNNWVSVETAKLMKAKPFPESSIVFAKVGAALLLNRRRILSRPTIIDNNMMAAIPSNVADTEFLYQLLMAIDFARFVQEGAVPSINQGDLSSFKLSYPDVEEQQKIAAALSNADQEIAVLQQKLEALKQEKKALMQQLLTGKRRVLVS